MSILFVDEQVFMNDEIFILFTEVSYMEKLTLHLPRFSRTTSAARH